MATSDQPKTGKAPRWTKIVVGLGVLLMLISIGTLATAKVLIDRYEGAVTEDKLLAPEARPSSSAPSYAEITGPLNFLLLGSDFRASSPGEGQRADTIIVVHVPRSLDRAYLVSIPRDLLVDIPANPATSFGGSQDKINAAFQYGGGGVGGTQLLSLTLTKLIDIRFHGAAIVNFDGFRKAVDVLGGVYLCVETTVASNHLGIDRNGRVLQLYADPEGRIQGLPPDGRPYVFEQGCRQMDGMLALDYVRIRYGLPSGDYDRQRHQQQFLKAVFQKATQSDIITNPIKFDEFLRSVGSALTVDSGGYGLADLIFGLRNVTPGTLVGVKVPSEPQMIGGVSYIVADPAGSQSLFRAIRDDTLDQWVPANPSWSASL